MFTMFGKSELGDEELSLVQLLTDAFEEFRSYNEIAPRFLLRDLKTKRTEAMVDRCKVIRFAMRGAVLFDDVLIRFTADAHVSQGEKFWLSPIIQLRVGGARLGHVYPRRGGVGSWGENSRIEFDPWDLEFDVPEDEAECFPDALYRRLDSMKVPEAAS